MRPAQRLIARHIQCHQYISYKHINRSFHTRRTRTFRVNNSRIYALSNRYFSNTTPRQKRRVTTWLKRIGLTFCGSISVLLGWLYYNHHEEENWQRSLDFWGSLYPIYIHYRFTDIYTNNWEQSDRDAAFDKLHDRYGQKIYEIIIHLQGFYLKLGQLGASRTDIIPKQWVELLRKLEDECPYQPFDIIEEIIKSDFGINSTTEVFEYIDPKPLGSASIGQVISSEPIYTS